MKKRNLFLITLIILPIFIVGCSQQISEEELENYPDKEIIYLPTAVIVDDNSYTIGDKEIEKVIAFAGDELFEKTNIGMSLYGIKHIPSIAGHQRAIRDYFHEDPNNPPQYIVIFSGNQMARSYGGYATSFSDLSTEGFCNNFVSPIFGSSRIYGAVIDWTQGFGLCGYDKEHYTKTGEYVRISSVSLADGSCLNHAGVDCVLNSITNFYVCRNFDTGLPYLQYEKAFLVKNIIHELMHHFGIHGVLDHFGTPECNEMMGSTDYIGGNFLVMSQNYCGMCPAAFNNFAESYVETCS